MERFPSKPQTFCFAFWFLPDLKNVCHKTEVSYFWQHTSGLGVFHFPKEKSSTLDGNYSTVLIYIYIYCVLNFKFSVEKVMEKKWATFNHLLAHSCRQGNGLQCGQKEVPSKGSVKGKLMQNN